jgi:transcriptional regulator with XRE-family HTH domain
MARQTGLLRKAHFLGTKIRGLRKRNQLTLEDLSVRCVQLDAENAPSVSYLSMIENGKRMPSEGLMQVIAAVFQKDLAWFFDETLEDEPISTSQPSAIGAMPLEPSFLFSNELLQLAIPELLSQTGTTGTQFAHLLIRAHQETRQNRFPDLERAAESVGHKQFPLTLDDLWRLTKKAGIKVRWFERPPSRGQRGSDAVPDTLLRSFYEAPNTVWLNQRLENTPQRLRYDLANHLGHRVLHDGDGARATQVSGDRTQARRPDSESPHLDAKDILYAWRDFECSYFAAALLAPKTPFRQFLAKHRYATDIGERVDLSPGLIMRRMTSVSPYRHWHYFDAYPPGNLRAVYRGNGIPLPWGNMRMVSDPCQHWAVFKMLNARGSKPSAQISVLRNGDDKYLYCCESVRATDAAGNPHVMCVGIDLAPALNAQGINAAETTDMIEAACNEHGGVGPIPRDAQQHLDTVAKILNIGWIGRGANKEASIICPRSTNCPRDNHCLGKIKPRNRRGPEQLREQILREADSA